MSGVLIGAPDVAGEPELVALMARPGSGLRVVRRCVDAVDLLGAATAGGANIALVGATLPRLSRDVIARLRAAGLDVVGVAARGDLAGEAALVALDVSEVRHLDDPGEVIADLTRRGTERIDLVEAVERAPARVIGVWGPPGAPGCTSVAIGLADEFARAGTSTLLIDADPAGGAVAASLGMIDEVSGLAIAARRADQGSLDLDGLARAARTLRPRLRVLTGIDGPHRSSQLRPSATALLVRMSRLLAHTSIIDIGTTSIVDDGLRGALTRALIAECDALVLVGSCDAVSMSRLIATIDEARELAVPTVTVVTRVRNSVVGRDAAGQVREALATHARVDDAILVPDDRAAYDEALREGRTLGECAARSPVRGALAEVMQRLSRIEGCLAQPRVPAA